MSLSGSAQLVHTSSEVVRAWGLVRGAGEQVPARRSFPAFGAQEPGRAGPAGCRLTWCLSPRPPAG